MEIRTIQHDDHVEVLPAGRLDEYWASHLETAVDAVIRQGAHRVRLNLSQVTYLSSAGIRVLMLYYKQLRDIHGSFAVIEPSAAVKRILDLTELSGILSPDHAPAPPAPAPAAHPARTLHHADANFTVLDYLPGASMRCRVIGDAARIGRGEYTADHVSKLAFSDTMLGLGLGAFGGDFDDCRGRFGEFLAVAGAAAYLPTDGTNMPDYLLSKGSFSPEVNLLYGLVCEGAFAHHARFEPSNGARGIKLAGLIDLCLDAAGADAAAIVMVAETAGLVGAVLRRSPASSPAASFDYPEIRNWISFTAEPAYAGSLCLLVGVAARQPAPVLAPLLRGLGRNARTFGHFHAAAFAYRPIRKDEIDLRSTVRTLFETRSLQGLLHVLTDDREAEGAGESELLRGACWIAPLTAIGSGAV